MLIRYLLNSLFIINMLMLQSYAFPIVVENCGKKVMFPQIPERAVINDINMAEMAFAIGIQDKIVGLTGISGWYKATPAFLEKKGDIPELAMKYPSLENLLLANADFFFAGWNYGMKIGGDVTPERLKKHGINTLVLSESCIQQNIKNEASMALLYDDMRNLGLIFDKQAIVETLIQEWEAKLAHIQQKISKHHHSLPKVFLYDSGYDKPFTAGRYAIVHALIQAGGGDHIMSMLNTNWGSVSWEEVAIHNPDLIILLDYQNGVNNAQMQHFLSQHPLMKETNAVKNQHYLRLRYEEITPGPANINTVAKIARALHPDLLLDDHQEKN